MTLYNKSQLKTFFAQGDIPQGTDYANFIDSQVNIAETAEQDMAGPLSVTKLVTPRSSAGTANFTGIVSAASLVVGNITSNGTFSTSAVSVTGNVSANSLNVTTDVSAATGTVYASAMRSTNGVFLGTGVVSAAGTAQATAAQLSFIVNRGKGIVDGSTTGFAIPANRIGLVQYLFNEGASANLWPPTGGFINGGAQNAALSLVASAMVTIVHLTASAYAVK